MKITVLALSAALGAQLLAGCMATTPHYDENFGQTIRDLEAAQIANPSASAADRPVVGLDGNSAKAAIDSYRKSFSAPVSDTGSAVSISTGGH